MLKNIKNRSYGNPISINFLNDLEVDIDYLHGVKEVMFIKDTLEECESIVEIGAGYGRTAHSILSLSKQIKKYCIIDLPDVLPFSSRFLKNVLDIDDYKKIDFISTHEINLNFDKKFDLCININSFQEMSTDVIFDYLLFIDKNCNFFYSNNKVGKFKPELCSFDCNNSAKLALESGLLKTLLNIFNESDLTFARKCFVENFSPSKEWMCVKHDDVFPWPHYYQALYKKL